MSRADDPTILAARATEQAALRKCDAVAAALVDAVIAELPTWTVQQAREIASQQASVTQDLGADRVGSLQARLRSETLGRVATAQESFSAAKWPHAERPSGSMRWSGTSADLWDLIGRCVRPVEEGLASQMEAAGYTMRRQSRGAHPGEIPRLIVSYSPLDASAFNTLEAAYERATREVDDARNALRSAVAAVERREAEALWDAAGRDD